MAKTKAKPTKPATTSKPKAQADEPPDSSAPSTSKLKPATAISARHILVTKHSAKEAVLERLRAGESFADVAREVSEDKARQGGALGWKVRGSLLAEFERVAYGLEVSDVRRPKWGECKTGEGWHVIMVEGRR